MTERTMMDGTTGLELTLDIVVTCLVGVVVYCVAYGWQMRNGEDRER